MKRPVQVNGEFFDNKPAAKAARGKVISPAKPADPSVIGSKNIPAKYEHEVHLGPDHWRKS